MSIRRLLNGVLFISLMISTGTDSTCQAQPAQKGSLVGGNTAFALDLYARLKSTPGNLFFSPYSISTCLAMTYAGARGDTEKQMAQVFRFTKDQAELHSSFGALQRDLREAEKQKGIELNIANALWAQSGHPFLAEFLKVAQTEYEANVNQADFKTQAGAVTEKINRWVAEKTKDKIQNILAPGSLDAATRLVLANAIYFKGIWSKPFDKAQTSPQPFHLSSSSQADVPLMHHLDNVKYTENGDFQAVELPYGSNQLSMAVFLPRAVDGCSQLENRLNPDLLSKTVTDMRKREVDIFLPRFKLESKFELNDPLSQMGMEDAFGPKADFSGMDGTRLLYISAVIHKAWGEVNEEGTEAAAATVVGMRALSAAVKPAPPVVFRADHPFLFLIRETRSGSVLFLGRLADPSK
jgi:serpin B